MSSTISDARAIINQNKGVLKCPIGLINGPFLTYLSSFTAISSYTLLHCPVYCYILRIYKQKEPEFAIHGYTNLEQRIHIVELKSYQTTTSSIYPLFAPYPMTTILINKHTHKTRRFWPISSLKKWSESDHPWDPGNSCQLHQRSRGLSWGRHRLSGGTEYAQRSWNQDLFLPQERSSYRQSSAEIIKGEGGINNTVIEDEGCHIPIAF